MRAECEDDAAESQIRQPSRGLAAAPRIAQTDRCEDEHGRAHERFIWFAGFEREIDESQRAHRETFVDLVGHSVFPADGIVESDPAPRVAAVFRHRQDLQGSEEEEEDAAEDCCAKQSLFGGEARGEKIEPQRGAREREIERDLVVSGQPHQAEEHARQCAVPQRAILFDGAELIEETERSPDGRVHHLGPVGGTCDAAQRVGESCGGGCAIAQAQRAPAECPERDGRGDVSGNIEPVQRVLPQPAVAGQRRGVQDEVEGIDDARLRLANERLAGPFIRVPERDASRVPFAGLELIPRHQLVGEVGGLQPRVSVGEPQLPIEAGDDERKQQRITKDSNAWREVQRVSLADCRCLDPRTRRDAPPISYSAGIAFGTSASRSPGICLRCRRCASDSRNDIASGRSCEVPTRSAGSGSVHCRWLATACLWWTAALS